MTTFLLAFVLKGVSQTRQSLTVAVATTVLGAGWIGLGLAHVILLRAISPTDDGRLAVFTVLLAVFASDTVAYFAGVLVGRHRMIACPSSGRDNVGVQTLAEVVEERLRAYPQHFEVAVLGCAVNGPGEAGDADFGIAGGRDVGFVYAHGRVLKKVSSDILVDELFHEIDKWIADGMHRPKRLKMAKPAALAMAEASMIPLE